MQQHGRPAERASLADWAAALKLHGAEPRPEGAGFRARCPGPRHNNGNRRNPSLSIKSGRDVPVVATCHAGCTFEEIRDAILPRNERRYQRGPAPETESWDYVDATGATLLTVHRRDLPGKAKDIWRSPKSAKPPRHGWPLSQLAGILADREKPILVVEGERTAGQATHLFGHRFTVTTAVGGAGKARQTDWTPVHGRIVYQWPDNDEAGLRHARDVDMLAREAGAKEVRTVREADLTAFPVGWDLADLPPPGTDIEAVLENAFGVSFLTKGKTTNRNVGFTPMRDLLSEPVTAVEWLWGGLIPKGGTALLVGPPKCGKSTMARNLAAAVPMGRDYLGRTVTQGPALYVTFEATRAGMIEHFRTMGTPEDTALTCYHGTPFDPTAAVNIIEAEIIKTGAGLLVLDTWLRVMRLNDANSYAEVSNATQPWINVCMATGCALLAVHHTRKGGGEGGEEASGSAALFASVDTLLSVKREDDQRTIYSRQREGADLERTKMQIGETKWLTLGGTVREERRGEALDAVLATLTPTGALTLDDICDRTRRGKYTVRNALKTLVKEGRALQSRTGKRSDPFRYDAPLPPYPSQ